MEQCPTVIYLIYLKPKVTLHRISTRVIQKLRRLDLSQALFKLSYKLSNGILRFLSEVEIDISGPDTTLSHTV